MALACAAVAGAPARAQTGYYNLDAGRPGRVEDALPAHRYELEVQFPSVRLERLANGSHRWRVEPKVVYGVAPFSELELRAPFIVVDSPEPGVPLRSGLGGVALGVMHAFGAERIAWPAVAIGAEWVAPAGALAAPVGSYAVKAIATKTLPMVRTHLNVAYGTYSSRVNACALPRPINVPPPAGCAPGAVPFDPPCDVVPAAGAAAHAVARCAAPVAVRVEAPEFDPARGVGMRWMAGLGADRVFPLASVLVTSDVVAERFAGLFARTDVSADVGVRWQWSPVVVLDAGVTRHFVGLLRANALTVGATYGMALPRHQAPPGNRAGVPVVP